MKVRLMVNHKFRLYKPEDVPFINHSYIRNMKSIFFPQMPGHWFSAVLHKYITSLLHNPLVMCAIIHNENDSDHIFGYLIVEAFGKRQFLHWAYVKRNFRNEGRFSDCLQEYCGVRPGENVYAPLESPNGWPSKKFNFIYKPEMLTGRKYEAENRTNQTGPNEEPGTVLW